MTKNILVLLCALLVFTSCQDTKSKRTMVEKKQKTEHIKTTQNPKQETLPIGDDIKEALDTIKRVGQKQLIPFLTAYGKENPETRIRIKTDFGDIEVELYKDTPLHRANFIRL